MSIKGLLLPTLLVAGLGGLVAIERVRHVERTTPPLESPPEPNEPPQPTASLLARDADPSSWEDFAEMHAEHHKSFVSSIDFGVGRMIPVMELAADVPVTHAGKRHAVADVDLLGLEDLAHPVAYTEAAEVMAEKGNRETRPLTRFETLAIQELMEHDVVAGVERGELRVLGALRASEDCAFCHDEPEGTLLGALSYRLEIDAPEPTDTRLDGRITTDGHTIVLERTTPTHRNTGGQLIIPERKILGVQNGYPVPNEVKLPTQLESPARPRESQVQQQKK